MTTAERSLQIERLWREQGGVCYYCGLSLAEWSTRCFSRGMGDGMELAHRVPRGELRRAGVDEWHPLALRLVCTRKGKRCNDGAMELTGLPRQSVIDEIREDMNAKTC